MCCIINFFKKRKESIAEANDGESKESKESKDSKEKKTVTIRDRSSTQTYNCRSFV